MKLAIGADHGGFKLKEIIKDNLKDKYEIIDFGTFSEESVDYPQIAHKLAHSVADGNEEKGILICRTGIGMSIAANKVYGIRCALCTCPQMAKLAKAHNDANIIAIPADLVEAFDAIKIIDAWLETNFEGGRHQKRVSMIEEE